MATDQPDNSAGTMLALYPDPDLAEALAVPGGLPPAELHLTVAYTGKADQVDQARLFAAAEMVAGRAPITATISGHARFTGGPTDVIVALVDSPELEQLRRDTVDALTDQGIRLPDDHGYIAHITLAYLDPSDPDPVRRLQPVSAAFGALSVVHGTDRADLLLDGGLAAVAREAYAQGWAASGGPMTDRVRAGCIAAVTMAVEHADQPGILEATLRLGHLEGTWAATYHRREQVHAANHVAITAGWKRLHLDQHTAEIVRRARRRAHLTEAAGPEDWLAELVRQLADSGLTADEIAQVRDSISDSLARAAAEGQAGAMAVSADQLGMVGFDFNLAFDHAYNALLNGSGLAGDPAANKWLTQLLGDQANEVGQALSQLTRDGASAAEMEDAVSAILTGADSRALTLGIDVLTSRAMSQGALDLYRSEGVELVDFITAGDQRVCPQCAAAEQDGPYRLTDAPIPGLHPLCRCSLAATIPLPGDSLLPFLGGGTAEDELIDQAMVAQAPVAAAKTPAENAAARKAARERYRQIAAREPVAKLASDVDQAVARLAGGAMDDTTVTVVEQAVNAARQAGMSDEALAPIEDAIRARDAQAAQAAGQQAAADSGLSPIGHVGDVVGYDPELHEPLVDGDAFDLGQQVQIWRQGHMLTLDGDTIRMDRAIVKALNEAEGMAVPADAAPYHLTLDGIEDLARAVEEGIDGTPRVLTGGSVGNTDLVTLKDGRQVVHKASRTVHPGRAKLQADAEQAASMIGRAMRRLVPRVYRNEVDAVWMDYIDRPSIAQAWQEALIADEASGTMDAVEARRDQVAIAIDSDQGKLDGLFDIMIRNGDRHPGNWLTEVEDQNPLIDHGYAFAPLRMGEPLDPPLLVTMEDELFPTTTRGPFAASFVEGDVDAHTSEWVENDLTPADVTAIRAALVTLTDGMAHLGLSAWLDAALQVLDVIEPYATGTRNLFAE